MRLLTLSLLMILTLFFQSCSDRDRYIIPKLHPVSFCPETKAWLLERPWPPYVVKDFQALAKLNDQLRYLESINGDSKGPTEQSKDALKDNPK